MADLLNQNAREQLDSFIHKVMEPLPEECLIDTHYNSIVRQQRRDAWRAANAKRRCYEALFRVACDVSQNFRYRVDAAVSVPSQSECLRLYREALAEQLLTPIEGKADIAWKRRVRLGSLPVSKEQVEAAIAADEAFLAAHPVRRAGRGDRK